MSYHYIIRVDPDTEEMALVSGDGTTLYTATPSYGVDHKRFLADAMAAEHNKNGLSDLLFEMFYVAFAETWEIEMVSL